MKVYSLNPISIHQQDDQMNYHIPAAVSPGMHHETATKIAEASQEVFENAVHNMVKSEAIHQKKESDENNLYSRNVNFEKKSELTNPNLKEIINPDQPDVREYVENDLMDVREDVAVARGVYVGQPRGFVRPRRRVPGVVRPAPAEVQVDVEFAVVVAVAVRQDGMPGICRRAAGRRAVDAQDDRKLGVEAGQDVLLELVALVVAATVIGDGIGISERAYETVRHVCANAVATQPHG